MLSNNGNFFSHIGKVSFRMNSVFNLKQKEHQKKLFLSTLSRSDKASDISTFRQYSIL
jgi:hypothetical protein